MKHLVKIFVLSFFSVAIFGACKNSRHAKKAIEWAKELAGKTVKVSKKSEFITKHGDDVIRHIELEKVSCPKCYGVGENSSGIECDDCDGDGYVYEVHYRE